MSKLNKRYLLGGDILGVLVTLIFLSHPTITYASVVINEVLPHPSSGADWIELYKTDSNDVDISGWRIQDSTGDMSPFPEGTKIASSSAFYQVFVSNRLNNGGDNIKLKDKNSTVIDEKSYDKDPGVDISLGRYPDGENNWGVLMSSSPNAPNNSFAPVPTPTPTSVPTSAPASDPTSTPAPSATSQPQNSPTPTKKPVVKTPTPIETEAELTIEKEEPSGIVLGETATQSAAGRNSKISIALLLLLIGGGTSCIIAAIIVSYKQIRRRGFSF